MKFKAIFEKAEEYMNKILVETFDLLDNNGNGFLEPSYLKFAMKTLGFEPSEDELMKIILCIDRSGKGIVRLDDFLRVMTARFYDTDTKEYIRYGFDNVKDPDGDAITVRSLAKIANYLGETMDDDTILSIINECDKDSDGSINYYEFLRVIKKTTPIQREGSFR